jgi:basic membrane lipoprotein Med (substrate-binding protein (PBP1-ABC) superfamily)
MKRLVCLFAFALAAAPVTAQQPPRAEVLVLGVYHMNNPGRDIFNTQADDVLAPKRQAELAQVVEVLKKFNPTRIAVERDIYDRNFAKRYEDYLAGKYELTRNEIDQLGLRLAKELGHKTVHAVDVDGDFPYQRFVNYAKGSGRTKELDALMGEIGAMVKAQSAHLASHTILETLLYMNADEKVAQDVGFYFRQAEFGEPGDWAGADLVADWYRRNIRIYANIMRLAAPGERVLVIYGAGHLGWLQQQFAGNPNVRLRRLAEFAR